MIFHGPQVYISPSWYETKEQSGEVVPTYNYAVVHAYGALRIIDERAWLRGLVTRLTERFESASSAPWRVSDAPGDFIDKQLGAIVGIEIRLQNWLANGRSVKIARRWIAPVSSKP